MARVHGFDPGASARKSFPPELLDYLKGIPCVRRARVAEIRRLLASGNWHPECARIAERILCEHLACPPPALKPPVSPLPDG